MVLNYCLVGMLYHLNQTIGLKIYFMKYLNVKVRIYIWFFSLVLYLNLRQECSDSGSGINSRFQPISPLRCAIPMLAFDTGKASVGEESARNRASGCPANITLGVCTPIMILGVKAGKSLPGSTTVREEEFPPLPCSKLRQLVFPPLRSSPLTPDPLHLKAILGDHCLVWKVLVTPLLDHSDFG